MRKGLFFGALAAAAAIGLACSSDDSDPTGAAGGSGGQAGSTGTAGKGGASGSGVGGGAGTAGTSAGGNAGTGGAAGTGGEGGTGIVDPCAGKFQPLPLAVSSQFPSLRICSGGTCTNAAMPYFFAPVANANCDEVIPDGGIVPPFPIPGPSDPDASDGATSSDATAPDSTTADAGSDGATIADPSSDGATNGETSADDATSADAQSEPSTADAGASDATPADTSVMSDASVETGADARADAAPPGCYEFLYNPYCTPPGPCWGGVIFTQSAGGMSDPGVCIENGATKITFKAKASRPDARIKFGSTREGLGATEFFMNITTEWTSYEVSIPAGEPYNSYSAGGTGVWNGFSVIVEPGDHPGGTYIWVKDATWVK